MQLVPVTHLINPSHPHQAAPHAATQPSPLDPSTFNLAIPRRRHSDAAILAALHAFAASRPGRTFSRREFDAWKDRPCSGALITERFGSWDLALARIGLAALRARTYDAGALVANLESVWRRVGHAPGPRALKKLGHLPIDRYRRHWGSVSCACRRLAEYHSGAITRDQLLTPVPAPRPARRAFAPGQRWRILQRDGHRCTICGKTAPQDRSVTLHIDHITPVSRGGGNDDSNLRVLCSECNLGRGAAAAPVERGQADAESADCGGETAVWGRESGSGAGCPH